jgi:hemerythrin superfamily protein
MRHVKTPWEILMALAKRKSAARRATSRSDAISLLKAEHRQVEQWFKELEKARTPQRKSELAANICNALEVHTIIEEEIFYPAFLEATEDTETHHEAELEHANAKSMIADIKSSSPEDDYYASRLAVLAEMIKHHVREEEKPGGMFAEARRSGMDLKAIGQALRERKQQLMGEGISSGRRPESMHPAAGH